MKHDYTKFIKVWHSAESVSEVAESLGITTSQASSIASMLRKNGVGIKKMVRQGSILLDSILLDSEPTEEIEKVPEAPRKPFPYKRPEGKVTFSGFLALGKGERE